MTEKRPPTPEEVQREFEDFVKKRFGDHVQIFAQSIKNPPPQGSPFAHEPTIDAPAKDAKKGFDWRFNYKPKEIKEYLDRFVIKQDEAKKALAIAVCDHYNHVKRIHHNQAQNKGYDYAKQNILILGPTGVGKTYLIKQIAKLIGVPFVKADATRFSETGYVGGNVDDLIHDLVSQANGNLDLAQYGIIYLDEADKLAGAPNQAGRDVTGRGVQFGLLKLMEETDVDLRAGNDIKSQMQAFMEFQRRGKIENKVINTRHILFIISGAFNGLIEIIKKRMDQHDIGFHSNFQKLKDDVEYLHHAQTQDFIDFGFEPEFIGRLPIRVACSNLKADDLYNILKNSEGSIVRQYEEAFRSYEIEVVFAEDALHRMADLASKEKTGARALMTVTEKILRNYKYELPSSGIKELVITANVIDDPATELKRLLENPSNNQFLASGRRVLKFADNFRQLHNMELHFTPEATKLICEMSLERRVNPEEICSELFQSYEHGLKLVQQNTGKYSFNFDENVVKNPKATLEKWIKDSYSVH